MNDVQILPVGAEHLYTFDFSADVPAGYAVTAIAFTGAGLSLSSQSNDYANSLASIKAAGSAHAVAYTLTAAATLNNGEVLRKAIAIRGLNE